MTSRSQPFQFSFMPTPEGNVPPNYFRMTPHQQTNPHYGIHPSDMQFMQSIAQQLFNFAPSHPGQHEIDVTFTTEPMRFGHGAGAPQVPLRPNVDPRPVITPFDENNYFVADDYPQRSGLSMEAVTSLPVHLARGKQKKELCSICRYDYMQDRFYRQLVCGHSFHPHCIAESLNKNIKCPVCRAEVK